MRSFRGRRQSTPEMRRNGRGGRKLKRVCNGAPGEQTLDIGRAQDGRAQGKPVIGPNSMEDDLARKAKAFQVQPAKPVSSSRNPDQPKR